ncbi:SGNH/GDSL hydrolase family protein [Candidatus Parcubacteria bacterium]|nr:SGNH/GDSL hydrolase family protein [Candidatus Parcubacteria bacterium]
MLQNLKKLTTLEFRFYGLTVLLLVFVFVGVVLLGEKSANIAAEETSLIDEGAIVLTTIGGDQVPSAIYGGQECYYDQKFVLRPEKRRTPLNPYGQKEESYIGCGVNTTYGVSDNTGNLTRLGTNVTGPLFYAQGEKGTQAKLPYLAIPNSDSFFEYVKNPTSSSGWHLILHKNISQKLETMTSSKTGEVRHYFDYSAGQFLIDRQGNKISRSYNQNYSPNGKFMVFHSNLGLMRLDIDTGEYLIFDKPHYNPSYGTPGYSFAISQDGRYAVVIKSTFHIARLYDLNTCKGDATLEKPLNCQSIELDELADRIDPRPNESGVGKPLFTSDNTLKFLRGYKNANGERQIETQLLSIGEPVLFNYLGLGDSFAAGEGAYIYKPGTDVTTPLNKCHLSLGSYPLLIGQKLGFSTYNSVACSGAKLKDIYSPNEEYYNENDSQAKSKDKKDFDLEILNNFLPGYRIQESFVVKYLPKNITVSVGGNDVGFGKLVAKCAFFFEDCLSERRERADMVKVINDRYYPLVDTYQRLKAKASGGTVNVIGYPQITSEDAQCELNVRLSKEELVVTTQLVKYLNSVIEKAAKRAGVVYVDVSEALNGHRLCEDKNKAQAVNGLTHGNDKFFDIGPIANESYHPNHLGQKLLEKKILAKTSGLSMTNPPPNLTLPDPKVEDAKEFIGLEIIDFNQPHFELRNMTTPVWLYGKSSSVKSGGFAPSSTVDAWLTSEPFPLGKFTSDQNGNIFEEILSNELPVGFHTLHLAGVNVAGEKIEQLQYVYVAYSEEDFDGDGVLNEDEACLVGEPAGVDEDRDGIDDACDGFIGEPPKEDVRRLPGFESSPDPKPPANNPETVAGNEPQPDTIAGVNPSTNQAPENSSSIQPNAGQPQNTAGNLQAGGNVPTGGDSAVNSLLSQGMVSDKPLAVGVAGASTEGSTAPANNPPPPAGSGYGALFIFLVLAALAGLLYIAYRKQKRPALVVPSPEFVEVPAAAAPQSEPKKHKKKKPKKPNHH